MIFLHRNSILRRAGFTLLEVIVTLAIFAIAILGFHQGQSSSARMVRRSEYRLQAMLLAQERLTEVELQLKRKNFEGIPEEEKGEFKEEKLKGFKWSRKFEKVNLGCFLPDNSAPGKDQSNAGAFSIAEKFFEQAIRKIRITVEWEEGNKKQKANLSELYVRFEDLPTFP